MNRRAFCLALAAAACSATDKRQRRRRSAYDAGAEPKGPMIVDKASPYLHRRQRSPLELFGDTLAQRTPNSIVLWDTLAIRRIDAQRSRRGVRRIRRLVAAFDVFDDKCVVHLIGRDGTRMLEGPEFSGPGTIFPAADASYYVLGTHAVAVLEVMHGRIDQTALLELPDGTATKRHLAYSLGDGRLVLGGGLHILERGKPARTYALAQRPMQVAPMPDDRCWLSYEGRDERVDALALVHIITPTTPTHQVAFPREHVLHLASSPAGELAALVFWLEPAPTLVERWAVVVLDPQGRERWRAEVPRSHAGPQLTTAGFVAIFAQRVVLHGLRDTLLAWDATTGNVVG